MKKSFIFIFVIVGIIFAQNQVLKQPPMPPMDIFGDDKQAKEDPCSLIPPMLYHLPPPLLKLVDRCNTKNLKPKKADVIKKLSENGFKRIKDLKIQEVEDLPRFYKITFKRTYFFDWIKISKELYCDWRIKFCFERKPLIFK